MPKDIQIFLPVSVLLGAILGLGILAQHNELMAIQVSGFTRVQIIFSVMKITIPLVFLTMVIGESIAPRCENMARNYRSKAIHNDSLLSIQKGFWAKDGNNFIYIENIKNNDELSGVRIYAFNHDRRLQSICYATSAKFNSNKKLWHLFEVNEFNFQDPKKINNSQMVSVIWKTNLTPDKLNVATLNPTALSIRDLRNYVKYLKSSGQDSGRYQLNMWNKIFQPISVAIMMLIALSFILGPLQDVPMGTRLITGVILGFIFYVFEQTIGPITLIYGISPIIGASFPSIVFLLISMWLLLKSS